MTVKKQESPPILDGVNSGKREGLGNSVLFVLVTNQRENTFFKVYFFTFVSFMRFSPHSCVILGVYPPFGDTFATPDPIRPRYLPPPRQF